MILAREKLATETLKDALLLNLLRVNELNFYRIKENIKTTVLLNRLKIRTKNIFKHEN